MAFDGQPPENERPEQSGHTAPGQFPGQQFRAAPGQPFAAPPNQPWNPAAGYPPLVDLGGSSRPPKNHQARNIILAAIGVIVVALVVAGGVGALAGSTKKVSATPVVTVPSISISFSAPFGSAPASASPPAGAGAPSASAGHVGSTIALTGESPGEKLSVTLVKVAPTTKATDGFSTPPAGDRYFAAQFRLTNTGTTTYSDAVDNDAVALDAKGQQYQTDIVDSVSAGPEFADQLNIVAGGAALGWIVFDVPAAATITAMQFTLDSGFADTGQWSVP
jgi:hypothetical protein